MARVNFRPPDGQGRIDEENFSMQPLEGKAALMLGTKRVGETVAQRLASEGVKLGIAYRSSRTDAEELVSRLSSEGGQATLFQGDVGQEEDVRRIVAEATEQLGGLDFVINLASGFPRTPVESLDGRAWDDAMSAAKGNYLLAVYAARRMMEKPGPTRGHIIFFGDWAAGETPYRNYLPYLTSKAAIHFMTRAFAVELAPQGILVNTVAPGPTMRPPDISKEVWERDVVNRAPLARESSATEMAELILTLLRSETITGEIICVDSGRHLAGPGSGE
jgi:NAD(P)-dependent dehydrogenase (short-subunit alcohol dehydrogenase family)